MRDGAKTAAIIDGGVIVGDGAARFQLHGWNVQVFDPDPEAKNKIGEVLDGARRTLPMLYDMAMPEEGTLRFCKTIEEAVAGASWVQEIVPERLDIKQSVYASIQTVLEQKVPIASSTSGFKPSELQEGASHPGSILVAHPFNPVYLLPLVEVVPGAADASLVAGAQETLQSLGMHPLLVRKEIDAHIADRFLEAVWREALWLIRDGIATTEEIDNAIRYGFGLRWGQMGLFETYRIAGGTAGMRHFIEQFGPALAWPWTKLMDVPDLDDALISAICDQSDAQSGHLSIRDLESLRDDNLVAMMRALKARGSAAGALLSDHEAMMRTPLEDTVPLRTVTRTVPIDWTDYNGHMNEGRYGQVFSDAADAVMVHVGADSDYIAGGLSFFTVETKIAYLAETHAAEAFCVETRVTQGEGKKLRLFHEMKRARDGEVLATCDQFLLHVSLETRRTCDPSPEVARQIEALAAKHAA